MAPWRVLEGYALEACMSSSSVASASQLHRSLFIEFDGELVWDKEDPEVWDNYVARVERGSCSARSSVAASDSLAADDRCERLGAHRGHTRSSSHCLLLASDTSRLRAGCRWPHPGSVWSVWSWGGWGQ